MSYIDDVYKKYLLEYYENTYSPERVIGIGKAVYVERNFEMNDNSNFCIVYFVETYELARRKKQQKSFV